MKRLTITIIVYVAFSLSAMAGDLVQNLNKQIPDKKAIKDKEKLTKEVIQPCRKKKIDINVLDTKKNDNKFVNWTNKKNLSDLKQENKINPNITINLDEKKDTKDFHKWANKTKDAIELNSKEKGTKKNISNKLYFPN